MNVEIKIQYNNKEEEERDVESPEEEDSKQLALSKTNWQEDAQVVSVMWCMIMLLKLKLLWIW